MEFVMTILEGAWRYVTTIRIADYLDIALMAYCCYLLLRLVRSTRAESLVKGIMVFLLALWISHVFKLNGIYFILNHMLDVGILALIVLFQPEIRRILEQVGSSKLRSFIPFAAKQQSSAIENAIAQTVLACTEMSKTRTGVLIVFEREINLDEMARTGAIVDAQVSSELLKKTSSKGKESIKPDMLFRELSSAENAAELSSGESTTAVLKSHGLVPPILMTFRNAL